MFSIVLSNGGSLNLLKKAAISSFTGATDFVGGADGGRVGDRRGGGGGDG